MPRQKNPKNSVPATQVQSTSGDEVSTALGLLEEAVREEELRIRKEGAQAMEKGDFDTATSVIEFARRLIVFQEHVKNLEQEWSGLATLRDEASPAVQEIVSKRFFGRSRSGDITPQEDFQRPLLETLLEMGGGGRTRDVLDRLGQKMATVLKPRDYEPHESNARQIRWRNTAQWARNQMVNVDGRMKSGTPNGRWEISDLGRAWLRQKAST